MVFRLEPALPVEHMKTYRLSAPIQTHTRAARCAEVDCQAQAHGWVTTVDVGTELGREQANYIRLWSGRHFTAAEDGNLVRFTFAPGQTCFAEHRVPLDRDAVYRVQGGDWRGNPRREAYTHASAADWQDDFANHQQHIADIIERG